MHKKLNRLSYQSSPLSSSLAFAQPVAPSDELISWLGRLRDPAPRFFSYLRARRNDGSKISRENHQAYNFKSFQHNKDKLGIAMGKGGKKIQDIMVSVSLESPKYNKQWQNRMKKLEL